MLQAHLQRGARQDSRCFRPMATTPARRAFQGTARTVLWDVSHVRGRPCCEWGGGGSVKTFSTRGVDASTARFCTKVRGACAEG